MTILLLGAALTTGCATKRYVGNLIDPIRAKLDQVATHTNWNAAAIDENHKRISVLEEHAESGIMAANERAQSAENMAAEALKRATEATNVASEARVRADKNMSGLESLRTAVSNFADYKLVAEATVQFEHDQDSLTREAKNVLDQFAAKKGDLKRFVVVVQGFTDPVGSSEYNNALSKRRADAVANYLAIQHNTARYRIYPEGLGSKKPVDEGTTQFARSKNRRVEVKIFSDDHQPIASTLSHGVR
jgi:outer membrane protein OmpA-like peptidoglycan-associated protein